MTEKLYYADSHIKEFTATVLSCEKTDRGYEILLDKTAFFPGGGGQEPDEGTIGDARVISAFEHGDDVIHITETSLEAGTRYPCAIDWEKRFARMQIHSGEHIISGIVYSRWGFNNVGFHMNDEFAIIDFDGELTRQELDWVETQANIAIGRNIPFKAEFPDAQTLKNLHYRSKLELTENVRIVTAEGYDHCACCAPHVKLAGEVGGVKILDFMRHRGGIRLEIRAGLSALADYRQKYESVAAISALLSVKQPEVASAVEKVLAEKAALAFENSRLVKQLVAAKADALPAFDGSRAVFEKDFDSDALRFLVNEGMKKTGGVFAALSGEDGSYRFVAGSEKADMNAFANALRQKLSARGGGKGHMIQGSIAATRQEIEEFFAAISF
ncbi:MAG: alanyl-tRNA editing protein [Oscillospiraceae bacterium]|nr:alanyl-tRNA editing protein [Oscillospiraceae bacterium]